MYAVVEVGARQYRVSPGERFLVEKLNHPQGSSIDLPVLLYSDETGISIGRPYVDGKTIKAQVIGETKGQKLIAFKYMPKKRYRKKTGHRQVYTILEFVDDTAPKADVAEPEQATESVPVAEVAAQETPEATEAKVE